MGTRNRGFFKASLLFFFLFVILYGCAGIQTKSELCKDESINRRAAYMVGTIASRADPGQAYYYVVIQSNEVNAFMDSTKNLVGITTGLMNVMDDDQLAFVVAHEVSHKKLGHYGKKVLASTITTTVMRIADIAVPGLGLLNYLVNPLVTNTFSREFELDADRMAAQIVRDQRGVSIERSISALVRLKDLSKGGASFRLLSTHPPIDDRIQKLASEFSAKVMDPYDEKCRAICETMKERGSLRDDLSIEDCMKMTGCR